MLLGEHRAAGRAGLTTATADALVGLLDSAPGPVRGAGTTISIVGLGELGQGAPAGIAQGYAQARAAADRGGLDPRLPAVMSFSIWA